MHSKTVCLHKETIRISNLFQILQDASGEAAAAWHSSGEDLARIGLMWVVVRYEVLVKRQFVPGEALTVHTWASPFRHHMSQRNYLICDETGQCVAEAAGIWTVVDRVSRSMVNAEESGIHFQAEITGNETPRPTTPRKLPLQHQTRYIVCEKDLDMNGHMNNTKYFDVVQDLMEQSNGTTEFSRIQAVYSNEAKLGDELLIRWGKDASDWFFCGEKNGEPCFQIGFQSE